MDRGKILWEEEFDKFLDAHDGKWGRYWDVDGDGIPYRTLPGITRTGAAYLSRGTGHDEFTHYSEEPEVWERTMNRLKYKVENAHDSLPVPIMCGSGKAKIGLLSYGSNDPAVDEAQDLLLAENIETDYMRMRALPIHSQVRKFIEQHELVYVIENNRDSQMWQILVQIMPEYATRLIKVAHCDGLPLTAQWISQQIGFEEGGIHD